MPRELSSYSMAPWPTQSSELKDLLQLQDVNGMTCHGYAKTTQATCRNIIARTNASRVPGLLQIIVSAGKPDDHVWQHLQDLASIAMCRRWHQNQAATKSMTWWNILVSRRAIVDVQNRDILQINAQTTTPSNSSIPHTQALLAVQITSQSNLVQIYRQELPRAEQTPYTRSNSRIPSTSLPAQSQNQRSPHSPGQAHERNSRGTTTIIDSPPSANTRSHTAQRSTSNIPQAARQETRLTVHTFGAYGVQRHPCHLNNIIRSKLRVNLNARERDIGGYIYGYTYPSNHRITNGLIQEYIKIGFSKDVGRRMRTWESQCHYTPQVVFALKMPYYRRIEKIVHTYLSNFRRQEQICPACGADHVEWFATQPDYAKSIALMWQTWAQTFPYDESGRLLEVWQLSLETINLYDPYCWAKFIYGPEVVLTRR